MTTQKPAEQFGYLHDEERGSGPCEKITISIDRDLLRRADAYAKARGLKRSTLFTIAVSLFMDELPIRRRE